MPKKTNKNNENIEEAETEAEIVGENQSNRGCCSKNNNRGGLFFGFLLVALGGALVAEQLVDFDIWQYFWPVILVLLGLSLIIRSF